MKIFAIICLILAVFYLIKLGKILLELIEDIYEHEYYGE